MNHWGCTHLPCVLAPPARTAREHAACRQYAIIQHAVRKRPAPLIRVVAMGRAPRSPQTLNAMCALMSTARKLPLHRTMSASRCVSKICPLDNAHDPRHAPCAAHPTLASPNFLTVDLPRASSPLALIRATVDARARPRCAGYVPGDRSEPAPRTRRCMQTRCSPRAVYRTTSIVRSKRSLGGVRSPPLNCMCPAATP